MDQLLINIINNNWKYTRVNRLFIYMQPANTTQHKYYLYTCQSTNYCTHMTIDVNQLCTIIIMIMRMLTSHPPYVGSRGSAAHDKNNIKVILVVIILPCFIISVLYIPYGNYQNNNNILRIVIYCYLLFIYATLIWS